jgi:hypothetical protein
MSYLVDGVVATGAGAFHAGETPQSSPTPQAYQETEPDDSTQESAPGPSSIPSTSVGSLLDDDVAKEIEVGCFLFYLLWSTESYYVCFRLLPHLNQHQKSESVQIPSHLHIRQRSRAVVGIILNNLWLQQLFGTWHWQ